MHFKTVNMIVLKMSQCSTRFAKAVGSRIGCRWVAKSHSVLIGGGRGEGVCCRIVVTFHHYICSPPPI